MTIKKKQMRDNHDDNKKGELKKVDHKRKKEKRDNLDTHEKELLNNYEKKERENFAMNLKMTKENRLKKVIK